MIRKPQIGGVKGQGRSFVTDDCAMADLFHVHFPKIFTVDNGILPSCTKTVPNDASLSELRPDGLSSVSVHIKDIGVVLNGNKKLYGVNNTSRTENGRSQFGLSSVSVNSHYFQWTTKIYAAHIVMLFA